MAPICIRRGSGCCLLTLLTRYFADSIPRIQSNGFPALGPLANAAEPLIHIGCDIDAETLGKLLLDTRIGMLDTDRTHAIWQTELALAGMLDIDIAPRMAAVERW